MTLREDGQFAVEENTLMAEGKIDPRKQHTVLHLLDGKVFRIPTAVLLQDSTDPVSVGSTFEAEDGTFTLPLVEERMNIGKRNVATGKVVLERHVHEYQEQLDVPLALRSYDVERVVLNQAVEAAPSTRREGNTMIYPVVEEQLVLTTRLILKEELRVTQIDSERRDTRTVTLKREHIEVVRSSDTES